MDKVALHTKLRETTFGESILGRVFPLSEPPTILVNALLLLSRLHGSLFH